MKAVHNKLIYQIINDPNYKILESGEIFNLKGDQLGYTIKSELDLRLKQYRYIKYKGKAIKIHRIIYAKFLGDLKPGKIIHHKDGDGLNNHVSNLEQCSQKMNMFYKFAP